MDSDDSNASEEENENENETLTEQHSAFLNQVDEILAECPRDGSVQRALFSATIGPFVSELASQFLLNHVHITVGTENAGNTNIKQSLKFVGREDGKLLQSVNYTGGNKATSAGISTECRACKGIVQGAGV